jgi:cell wall-associated NlpC family hydrolase
VTVDTATTPAFDPRVTASRRDLAAASLRGLVQADRYVEGEPFTVLTETADLKRLPRPDAALETQMLYGETLTVYDDDNGWGWAQSDRDGYVGYVAMSALARSAVAATHRVTVRRTFIYPAADMKQPPYATVPLDGRVAVEGWRDGFAKIRGHGFLYARHVAPLDVVAPDYVAVAEDLVGVPYLWGGKSPLGIDCSGLVQLSCAVAGLDMPRDTDMQARVGHDVPIGDSLDGLRRGDLVFWKGHVGIMLDGATFLHANAHHMLVSREPFSRVRDRSAAAGLSVSSVRRII